MRSKAGSSEPSVDKLVAFSKKEAMTLGPQPAIPSLCKHQSPARGGTAEAWERGPGWLIGPHRAVLRPWGPQGSFGWKDVI